MNGLHMKSRVLDDSKINFQEIQYVGVSGISIDCRDAVLRFIQYGDTIDRAWILSCDNFHSLILLINGHRNIAVKSGFASGYNGEGPRTFSFVLQTLSTHGSEIEEYVVNKAIMERLDRSALRKSDVDKLNEAKPVRPTRWHDYVFEQHWRTTEGDTVWSAFPHVIPFSIIDARIADLAIRFWEGPDEALLAGYRRLEGIVRSRCQIEHHGAKLFSEAFKVDKGALLWSGLSQNEHTGRTALFTGAFMAYRNPRAHKEKKESAQEHLSEFLLLNMLFRLERSAKLRE